MSNPDQRIPDDTVAKVLAEAARLHAETHKGCSLADLQQICSEAQIPAHIVNQAIKNVEEKRSRQQVKRRELQEYIQQQIKRGLSVGIALLIPAIAVSSLLIFRSQLNPLISGLVDRFKPNQQPATVAHRIEPLPQPNSPVAKVPHADSTQQAKASPKPVMLREDFRSKVEGKTKQEVIQAVGRPDSTNDMQGNEYMRDMSYWHYDDGAQDPASGKVGSVTVRFEDGIVDSVDFSSY
jgi:hypothetical protein